MKMKLKVRSHLKSGKRSQQTNNKPSVTALFSKLKLAMKKESISFHDDWVPVTKKRLNAVFKVLGY